MDLDRRIIANTLDPEEMRVAILEKGKLVDIFYERMWESQKNGDIYKARVDSVVPGIHAAFVNLGDGRNAFLYLNDIKDSESIKTNSEIIVQVVKTARKNKGARVTGRLSLPGRYMVLVPHGHETGVSKRIEDEDERERLRSIARNIRPDGFGLIIRTAAEGTSETSMKEDLDYLMSNWEEIEKNSKIQSSPCLIYRDLGLVGRILRDELNDSVSEIIVDNRDEYERIDQHIQGIFGDNRPDLELYDSNIPVFEFYGIERELESVLDRKVWLDSGAYLIIDQTEALTVIDVNTGKFIGDKDLRNTVFKTNMEASIEIARQLKVRAIGGIIVIDFIDMEHEEDRNKLTVKLEELFQKDRYKAKVFGISQLGLVELTRKRARQDIRSGMTRGCPFCGGYGWVLKEDTVAVSIKRFLRKVSYSNRSEAFLIEMYPAIAKYISETYLAAWEEELERRIFIIEAPEFAWDKYRIEFQGPLDQIQHKLEVLKDREAAVIVHKSDPA